MELSIVIISYNTKEITKDCINSIYQSLDRSRSVPTQFEILVIDNNSTDDSVEMLQQFEKKNKNFRLIQNKENVGFARANNQGANLAKGEYLLFLNSDTIVLDTAIHKLLDFARITPHTDFVGGKLFNKDMTAQASCGPFYSLPVIFVALFLRGDYYGLTRSSPNATSQVDWVSGACILTKKEYFKKVGGFDEKIFMYMDEIDLLYRAKKQGYRVFFCPQSQFIHLGSASSGNHTYPILQVYRGFMYFYKKHHSPLAMFFLKAMLQLKATIAVGIGKITQNKYLVQTYGEAQKLVTMA